MENPASGFKVNDFKTRAVSSKIRAASLAGLRAYLDRSSGHSEPVYKDPIPILDNVHKESMTLKKEIDFRAAEGSPRSYPEKKFDLDARSHSRSHSTPLKPEYNSYTPWLSQRSLIFEQAPHYDGIVDDGTLWTPSSTPHARSLNTQQSVKKLETDFGTSIKGSGRIRSAVRSAIACFIALALLSILYINLRKNLDGYLKDEAFLSQAMGGDLRPILRSYNHEILKDLESIERVCRSR